MGKTNVCCPNCSTRTRVTKPDNAHPFWSFDKLEEDEGVENIIEQELECTNPTCKNKFRIYWYDK
jgi:hypothetical protein